MVLPHSLLDNCFPGVVITPPFNPPHGCAATPQRELHHHLSFATGVPPSPELNLHLSFAGVVNNYLRFSTSTSTGASQARPPFPGRYHRFRRHRHRQRRPTGTYFINVCIHCADSLVPSSRYQLSPASPPLLSTSGLLHQLFQPRRRQLRRGKTKFTTTNIAGIFTNPLLWTTTASTAAVTCALRDTHNSPPCTRPTPSSTNHDGLLQPHLLPSAALLMHCSRTPHPHRFALGSVATQPFKTIPRVLPEHRPIPALLPYLS